MAFIQREQLSTGELIGGTFAELRENARVVLIYLAVLVPLGMMSRFGDLAGLEGILGLAVLVAFFVGQYLLFEAMLANAGFNRPTGSRRFFRFTGLAFVVLIAVMFGFNFFFVPGVILAARWIMAPSLMVAERHGTFASLGESWRSTGGNTLALSLAVSALVLIVFAATFAVAALASALGDLRVVDVAFGHLVSLLFMGLSVAVYRRLNTTGETLSAVFA